MALLHRAQIRPTKLELLAAWLPLQPWFGGGDGAPDLEQLGAYRFDDPDGEVGVEVFLLRDGRGRTFHVPVTYRPAPLPEALLMGPMEHSVLGPRWVYDACTDPVYATTLATAILTGGTQAAVQRQLDDGVEDVPPTAQVRGSGGTGTDVGAVEILATRARSEGTVIITSVGELVVRRELGAGTLDGDATLTGTWGDVAEPVVLAVLRR